MMGRMGFWGGAGLAGCRVVCDGMTSLLGKELLLVLEGCQRVGEVEAASYLVVAFVVEGVHLKREAN